MDEILRDPVLKRKMFQNLLGTKKNKKFTANLLEACLNLKPGTLKDIKILGSCIKGKGDNAILEISAELPNNEIVILKI